MLDEKRTVSKVTAIDAGKKWRLYIIEKYIEPIGRKAAARVVGMTDATEIQAILQEEIDSAFQAAEAEIESTK